VSGGELLIQIPSEILGICCRTPLEDLTVLPTGCIQRLIGSNLPQKCWEFVATQFLSSKKLGYKREFSAPKWLW